MQSISICLVLIFLATSFASATEDENSVAPKNKLSIGHPAPSLAVSKWSDGRKHSLSDYRGKVVVLHFWGKWCLPCVKHIPVWKRLEEEFEDRAVVFLGIHTAGDNMAEVKAFMKEHDWEHLTAVDTGETRPESMTFKTYKAKAVNHVVVIDEDGKIFYGGGRPTQTEGGPPAIAKLLGLPGLSADVSEEEMDEAAPKILAYMYGKEIEGALKSENTSTSEK